MCLSGSGLAEEEDSGRLAHRPSFITSVISLDESLGLARDLYLFLFATMSLCGARISMPLFLLFYGQRPHPDTF